MIRTVLACLAAAAVVLSGAAGIGAATRPTASTWTSDWFRSPTGNIRCHYYDARDLIVCTTRNNGAMVGVPVFGRAFLQTSTFGYTFPLGPVLEYGDRYTVGGSFRCNSSSIGMSCESTRSGHGFLINRSSRRLY